MNVERWDTCEFAFRATDSYTNPFRDVELVVTFTHEPSGRAITVNGFHDGDATWRVRFMPTELGAWRYTTASTDPGLNGQTGGLECVKPVKPYLHGPLACRGYHFFHADGTPRFLISTRLSCQFAAPEIWARVIPFLQAHRINRVFFIMGGVAGTLRDLFGEGPDFDRYNVAKWRAIDAFIDALRGAGIQAGPYFYYFNDGVLRGLSPEQDRAYIKYGMARFGAYANVMPVLSNEVEQKYTVRYGGRMDEYDLRSQAWANEMGPYLKELAVFGVPVTVHNPMENFAATNPGFYTLLYDWPFPWADYMMRQAQVGSLGAVPELRDDVPETTGAVFNERAYARHNQLMIDLRKHGIPVINEEPGYEMGGASWEDAVVGQRSWNTQTAWRLLSTFWTAAAAGCYAMWGSPATYELGDPMWGLLDSAVPERLRILHDFMIRFPYWQMAPANEAVSANGVEIEGASYRTNYCLARAGERYLVFSLHGGTLSLDLQAGTRYYLTHLDPRTGEERYLGLVGGGECVVTLPAREQVLLAQRV